jgi:NAD(P)-dependent dehydrogenase (short-subunit alcohol dehydrogenase family)
MMKAILTGHTRGLGAAIAANLLARKIPVLGLSRSRNAELEKRFPTLLQQFEIDWSDPTAATRWLGTDALRQFLSGCQTALLINNAGTVQPIGPVATQDVAAVSRAVNLNVAAPLMLTSAVAAASADASDRRILHISSGAASNPYPGWSIYCATKAAVDHHARSVALDRTPALRICALAPGVIDTDMQAEIRATAMDKFPLRERFEALKQGGQLSSPDESAKRLIDYLLSDQFGQHPVADLRQLQT